MQRSSDISKPDDSGYTPAVFPQTSRNGLFGAVLWRWDARTGQRLSSIRWLVSRVMTAAWFGFLWHPLTREILRECYSFPHRIGTICATKPYLGISLGRIGHSLCALHSNEATLARSEDMQYIKGSCPWATLLDQKMFLEGWNRGARWAEAHTEARNSGQLNRIP